MEELQATLAELDKLTGHSTDLMTVVESRLFDQKIRNTMVPTQQPVRAGHLASAFGWRIDPFTGRNALHTGLDFQADTGTPILAAAGGVVRRPRSSIPPTATWSRSTTATTWSRAMPTPPGYG